MSHILNTSQSYSTPAELTALISSYAAQGSLNGMRIVITGYSRKRYRWEEWAAFEMLGATIGDSASAVRESTVVLVNPYANPNWVRPNEKGTKLIKAREKGAQIFRLVDFLAEMRRQHFVLPLIFELACRAEVMPRPPTATQIEFDFTDAVT